MSTEGDSAAQTFASETESKHQPSESSVVLEADPCVVSCKETIMRSQENNHNNSNSFRASESVHSVSSCEKHMCTEDVGPKSSISTSLPGRFNVQSSSHAQGAEECSRPRSSGDDDAGRALHGESDVRGLGESKKGCTFEQAFQAAQWTEFILNRFEKSTKPEHRMYVRFVELKLKEMSTGNTAIKTKNTKKMPETSQAEPVPFDVWEELQSMEGEPTMEAPMLKEGDGRSTANESESVKSNEPGRDSDERAFGACPQAHRGEERGLSCLSLPESEDLGRKVFAESTLQSADTDTDLDFQKTATEDTFHRLIQNMVKKL